MDMPESAVPRGAEGLEDRAVEDVGPDPTDGLKPKTRTSMGVISEPPPIPVMPTRRPISSPATESFQSTGGTIQPLAYSRHKRR
jgi:hypothetical protein